MKIDFLTAAIAAVILSLPLPASGASSAQSALDPLAIQEEAPKKQKPARQKRSHNSQRRAAKEQRRSQLSETLNSQPESMNTYRTTVADLHLKTPRANKSTRKEAAQSKLSWNSRSAQHNAGGSFSDNSKARKAAGSKNMFQRSTDTAGKIFTAPARGLHALFNRPKQSQPRAS